MFLNMLEEHSAHQPNTIALRGHYRSWTWQQYHQAVNAVAEQLTSMNIKRLALEMDNCPEWAILDIACLICGVVFIPIPPFFTEQQKAWVLSSSSVDAYISEEALPEWQEHDFLLGKLQTHSVKKPVTLPAGTAKITYTSGTTGEPKGVCLSLDGMLWTARTLATALRPLTLERHLVTLPLCILLENVCGIYIPLLLGAETIILSSSRTGFEGSSRFNPSLFLKVLNTFSPQSLVLVPELLRAILYLHQQSPASTRSLRFIATGGGKVPASLLAWATRSGLPVYEGYGLSECGSVVALNLPAATKVNSVGRPLSGISVSLDDQQQLFISSPANALGYLGAESASSVVATGDLASIDDNGFISIHGRLKNVQINAFGRNFSPEWPEAEAMACSAVRRVVIFGEGLKHNVALVDAFDGQQELAREQLMSLSNRLPDYAQFHRLLFTSVISQPGMLTENGRPRREYIRQSLWQQILNCSEEETL